MNITNKSLTIYGNGTNNPSGFSIIDGNSSGNYTLVINGTSNVTLYNIIFTNSNRTAVLINLTKDGSVTFINCIFTNNTSNSTEDKTWPEYDAGAVYITGTSKSTFTNCNFTNNNASNSGGAVMARSGSTAIFSNCNFIDNHANASAISGSIPDTKIDSGNSGGGAVKLGTDVNTTFTNCNFINNTVGSDSNKTQGRGGAVYVDNSTTNTVNFTNCTFIGNNAIYNGTGGAVYLYPNSTTIFNNTIFINNNASSGGAVFVYSNATQGNSSATFINTTFIGNTANGTVSTNNLGIDGGAVYVYSNSTVNFTDSKFINNTADKNGGAVTLRSNATGTFNNVTFEGNSVKGHTGDKYGLGGALKLGTNVTVNVTNSAFYNNTAFNGSAIFVDDITDGHAPLNVVNTTFEGNTAAVDGGAVYMNYNATANFIDCLFEGNVANNSGGAVILRANATANFTGTTFNNNTAKSNNFSKSGGGAVKLGTNCTVIFNNTSFNNNTALGSSKNSLGNGSAVYIDDNNQKGNTTFVNSSFDGNNGDLGTVYMYINSTTSFTDCNFTNNKADQGGAVYISTNATGRFTNCTFINNSASEGGVAYINGPTNTQPSATAYATVYSTNAPSNKGLGLFDGCTFDDNKAKDKGGAIYNNGTANVTDSEFENNSAVYGGAIYSENVTDIANTTFNNNNASIYGGGLYIANNGKAILSGSSLKNNSAISGPAIYSAGEVDLNNDTTYDGKIYFAQGATFGGGLNVTVYANNKTTVDLYGYSVLLTANLTEDVEIQGEVFFNVTYNNKSHFYKASRDDDGIYYYEYHIPEFGANYTVSVLTPSFGSNYNVSNATIFSVNNFNINITANNVTVSDANATANNTIEIYILNDGHTLANNNVTVYVNGIEYTVELNYKSEGVLVLDNLTPGEYNVTVVYGNGNATVNNTATFYVKYPVSINDTVITFKDNGDNTTNVSIEFPKDVTGNITVTINGTEYNATIIDGVASFIVNGTFPDFANVSIYYPGNNVTGGFNETLILDLRKIELNVNGSTVTKGENSTVNVGLTINDVPANENVTITVTGSNYNKTFNASVVNGSSVVDLGALAPGAYNVTVQYSNKVATTMVYVKNNITLDDITIEASKNANGTADLTLTVPEGMTGNITFTVNGVNYTAEIINGTATVTTDQPYDEAFNVTVSYVGDDANYPFNYTYNFDTSELKVVVENVTMYYKNGSGVVVSVSMGDTPLANQTVGITINGRTYNRTTDENGTAKLTLNLNPGVYNVTTTYTGVDGQNYTVQSTVTILSTISGENIVKYYGNGTRYYATFLDAQGNPLANTVVTFNIHGVFYNATTDENGTASLAINLLPNEYIITAYNPINNQSFSNNITVLNTVNTTNLVKYFRNGTQFSAKVVDGTGNAVAGSTVTFNINGVFYNRTTNGEGVATLNINLNPGDYTITTYNNLTGQNIGNTVKVLPVLSGSDLTKVYGQAGSYTAHLVDGQGAPYANQEVTFNINGRMYHKFTDANGDARLSINLLPGRYIITAYAGSAINSNTITVLGGA